nr:hypothetical protein [Haloarcula sp. CBA1129]
MTLVVPFDGSELAEAALVRATEFGTVFEEDVLAVSVIRKGNAKYARERDWLKPNEEFDLETVVTSLHEQVMDLCPSSDFRHTVVIDTRRLGLSRKPFASWPREKTRQWCSSEAKTPAISSQASAALGGQSHRTTPTTSSSFDIETHPKSPSSGTRPRTGNRNPIFISRNRWR